MVSNGASTKNSKNTTSEVMKALNELKGLLDQYYITLKNLTFENSTRPKDVRRKVKQILRMYKDADHRMIKLSLEILDTWFEGIRLEYSMRDELIGKLKKLAVEPPRVRQHFAASVLLLASFDVVFKGVLQAKVQDEVFANISLPPELGEFKKKEKNMKYWLLVPAVGWVVAILSVFNFKYVVALVMAIIGFLALLIEKFYISERFYAGSTLPGTIANNIANELPVWQRRISHVEMFSRLLSDWRLPTWPDSLTRTVEKLLNNEYVSDQELLVQTDVAISLDLINKSAIEKIRSDW